MKLLIITIVMLLLSACHDPAPAIKRTKSSNPGISIDFLFEKDGYKMYRFMDDGREVYFTVPSVPITEIHSENCGKGCIKSVETQTVPTTPSAINKATK